MDFDNLLSEELIPIKDSKQVINKYFDINAILP